MRQKDIKFVEDNLVRIVQHLNRTYNDIWYRSYPPFSINNTNSKEFNPVDSPELLDWADDVVIYIHVPFCSNNCNYCGLRGCCDLDTIGSAGYTDLVIKEIEDWAAQYPGRRAISVMVAGGTPSLLEAADLERLFTALRSNFEIHPLAQIAMELSPPDIDESWAAAVSGSGVNRVCLGVQTFKEKKNASAGRKQNREDVTRALDLLRGNGVEAVTFDMIFGLGGDETAKEFLDDNLLELVELAPDDISYFQLQDYTKFPQRVHDFPLEEMVTARRVVDTALYQMKQGYNIEPKKEERTPYKQETLPIHHSQYYFLRRCLLKDVVAFGLGSVGCMWRKGRLHEVLNRAYRFDLKRYRADIGSGGAKYGIVRLSEDESLRRHLIYSLNSRYDVYASVLDEKFFKYGGVSEIFSRLKDKLIFKNDIFYLKKDYLNSSPFKVRNDYVNYFLFCFFNLYSPKYRDMLRKHFLQNHDR